MTMHASQVLLAHALAALAASLLFVGAGAIFRWPSGASLPPSFRFAARFVFGASLFMFALVPLSRIFGARTAMYLTFATFAFIALLRASNLVQVIKSNAASILCLAGLVPLYSAVAAALWMPAAPPPYHDPLMLSHFGTIHAGRYANYAMYIAEFDRIPFLGQNAGQVILASILHMLGSQSPLAAMMIWLPIALSILTILVFGLFVSVGFTRRRSAICAALFMFGSTSATAIHLLVWDNGSPFGFIGYPDLALSVASFITLVVWGFLNYRDREPLSLSTVAPFAILAATWAWYAPQNLVIAAAVLGGLWACRKYFGAATGALHVARISGVVLAGAVVGALQLGSLLPERLREDIGFRTYEYPVTVEFRPYAVYVRNHWTSPKGNLPPEKMLFGDHPYEKAYAAGAVIGPDEIYRNIVWLFEDQAWSAIRAYAIPMIGITLLCAGLRSQQRDILFGQPWLLAAALALAASLTVSFGLTVSGNKWWVTRFLVPGVAMGMLCFCFEVGRRHTLATSRASRGAWLAVSAYVMAGPMIELAAMSYRGFFAPSPDPIAKRAERLVETRGPIIWDDLTVYPGVRQVRGLREIEVKGGHGGIAISTAPMPKTPGVYEIVVRASVKPSGGQADQEAFELVVVSNGTVVHRQRLSWSDFESRKDGTWAHAQFELPSYVKYLRAELWNRSVSDYQVSDFRLSKIRAPTPAR